MNNNYTEKGILLKCNREGVITEITFNSLSPEINMYQDKLFIELFREDCTSRALDFLAKINKDSATFDWEVFLKFEFTLEPVYLGGANIDGSVTIFGSHSKVDVSNFISGLMLINNDQVNKIRELEKHNRQLPGEDKRVSNLLFDELSKLNNELVAMQRELAKKNNELAKLNEQMNQFVGMAAHDLRNPLGNILIYSEFLKEDEENLNEEQIEFINQIGSLSKFMLNLVTDLLDVSTIESGKIELKSEQVDLQSLIEKVVYLNNRSAEKKNIKLTFEKSSGEILLNLDSGKIEQVLSNLISNAIKYSNPDTETKISTEVKNNIVTVSVKDGGLGIAENELKNLFKPFQTANVESTDGERSTGLGLYIARRIIEAHNGKINVESKLDSGSNFYFSLPLNR